MKIKLNVRQKITVFILSIAISLFAILVGYFSITSQRYASKVTSELTRSYTDHYAMTIENWLGSDMAVARTLSHSFLENKIFKNEDWRALVMGIYHQVMHANPHFDAIWDSWELSYLDPKWELPHGRLFHISWREGNQLLSRKETRSLDGDPPVYAMIKAAGKEAIIEPYLSVLQKGGLMTSLAAPMYVRGKYAGLVGIDLFLGRFQNLISTIKPYGEGQAFLLSSKGTYIAHPDTSIFSKKIQDVYPEFSEEYRIIDRIAKGEKFSFTYANATGEKFFYSFSPVVVGRTQTPWSLGIAIPQRVILKDATRSYNIGLMVGVFGVIVLILSIALYTNKLTRPITQITKQLEALSLGKIDNSVDLDLNSEDEIARMGYALSKSIAGLIAKAEFAKKIGEGKLNTEMNLLSEEDVLGKSLIEMQESLKRAEEEEVKRKEEDEKRRWANEGLAKFGDILRQNNDNMMKLGDEIIKNLVWCLDANLGGIFVKNETTNPITYELVSAFAYDRNRYLQSSFEIGEGLIGSCAAEKGTIYLVEVPQDYIQITSGLGDTNPNNILVIPLIIEDEVMGVIELASINIFPKHYIEFVEKLGESIASTLRTVRINQKTTELLQHSQEQTEMLIAQEEEMRQNLEELQATQEEATRKSFEMDGIFEALNASAYVMEYDSNGKIININDSYLELLGISREDAIGMHHSDNLIMTEQQRMQYEQFWSNLRKGETQKQTTRVSMGGKEFTFLETYTPIRNAQGDVFKILKVAADITSTDARL